MWQCGTPTTHHTVHEGGGDIGDLGNTPEEALRFVAVITSLDTSATREGTGAHQSIPYPRESMEH